MMFRLIRRLIFRKHSVLFVRPDYHTTFLLRNELEKQGWRADVYVPWEYPEKLLYSRTNIIRPPRVEKPAGGNSINVYLSELWFLVAAWTYDIIVYSGKPPQWGYILSSFFPKLGTDAALAFSKLVGTKLVFSPMSCHEEASKAELSELKAETVCGNCGFWDRCDDKQNNQAFESIRKFFDLKLGTGALDSTQFSATHVRWRSLDMDLWKPDLAVPEAHKLPSTGAVRIVHAFANEGRTFEGRNIKGSPFVRAAVDRLRAEGHDIELQEFSSINSRDMRFYQAQADIIIDQLHYGWWGSTSVEGMSLGKPVICFIRPEWKDFFLKTFNNYSDIPIVESNSLGVYEAIRSLAIDESLRLKIGKKSRAFAMRHFDVKINALEISRLFNSLI
jgi:hypothetical protein